MRLKICKAQPRRYNVSSPFGGGGGSSASNQSHITITIPLITQNTNPVDNLDAERRRSKALKALKERLKKPGDAVEQLKSEWNADVTSPSASQVAADPISAASVAATTATSSSLLDETKVPNK